MAHATAYKEAGRDVALAVPKRVWTAITTAIAKGDTFCYNGDLATDERGNTEAATAAGSGRHRVVEKPALANIGDFAGFAAQAYPANASGQWIEINVPRIGQTLPVKAKANCTIMSSVLGPIPTQHHVREGCLYPEAGFALLALQTVDRSSTAGEVQCRVIPANSPLVKASTFEFFDDFFQYDPTATVGKWTVVEDAGATHGDKIVDGAGGIVGIGCDGDDNDECYASSVSEVFKVAAGKPIRFKARMKLAEANTDDANFIIGLSDTVAADSLLDNAAGPMASYDGAVFFKVDGGKVFQFETSNAGDQVTDTDVGAFTTDTWTELEFLIDPNDGTTAQVSAWVDGVLGNVAATQALTIAGMEEMHVLLGVKAGGANEEVLQVDYVLARQAR